jgi:hypothetical protein
MSKNEAAIKSLIDKYFEGLTTLEEERWLREYFRRDAIPEQDACRAMFRFFTLEREATETGSLPVKEKKRWKIHLYRTGVAAAACMLLYAGLRLALNGYQTQEISRAYINGKAYTNLDLIQSEALKGLVSVSEGSETALAVQIEALEFLSE